MWKNTLDKNSNTVRKTVWLLLTAVIKLVKKAVSNVTTAVIAAVSLLLEILLGLSPVYIVASGILIGVLAYFAGKRRS